MRHILRQAMLTAVFFAGLYGAALAITFILMPEPPRAGRLDLATADETLYLTEPKYAFLGRDVLDIPDRKVLLLGASNTGVGFRPPQLQPLVPCAKVSNLAIGGANITEVRQMVDLVHEVQDAAARRSNTFVFGIWYGMFADSEQFWRGAERHPGDTDLDIERYRYGFYRRTPTGPVAVLPPSWLHAEVSAIRPYLLLEKVARDVTFQLRGKLFVRPPMLTDAEREKRVMSAEDRASALAYWRGKMGEKGEISIAQVKLLQDTIEELLRSGEKVVLVDLPIPAWHRKASPYEASYLAATQKMLFRHFAGRRGFASLTMPDLDADENYSDEVHGKPHIGPIWSARLASVLDPLVCPARTMPLVDASTRAFISSPP